MGDLQTLPVAGEIRACLESSYSVTLSSIRGCHKVVFLTEEGGRRQYEGTHGGERRIKLVYVQDV